MSERKLVTIQTVTDIQPIPGADNIDQARVMGWTVVVKKGEFQIGDPCIFFEIDSVLPDGPEWSEFMRPRGFRVKTVRLRGVLSQGLALPITILPRSHREIALLTAIGRGEDISSTRTRSGTGFVSTR